VTFKDLQKLVQSQSGREHSQLLQRLRDKPFLVLGLETAQTRRHQNKRRLLL